MITRSVIIFCLCFAFSTAFSISANATPTDEKSPPSESTFSSSSAEEQGRNSYSDSSNSSAPSPEVDSPNSPSTQSDTEIATQILNDQISTILGVKQQEANTIVLAGKQWSVKSICNGEEITLSDVQPHQSVYISGCQNTIFIIPLSLQHIAHLKLQDCTNVTVRCPSVISSIELSDCSNITINCYKNTGTIQLDNVDGCKVYLPSETADRCIFTHSQCKNLTVYRVLKINDETVSQPLLFPDSVTMSKGQDQVSAEKERGHKIPDQYLARMEKDPTGIYKTDKHGKLIKNPKGEWAVIKQHSKGPGGELLSVKRCLKDRNGQYLVVSRTKELILEESCEWMYIKRFRMDQSNILTHDPNGDIILITRNTNQLKDDQGYLILPENNKFPSVHELLEYHMNKVIQPAVPSIEPNM